MAVDDGAAPRRALPHLAEIAGWTRAHARPRLRDGAASAGVPIFLGGDHSISMGTISGVARRCAEQGRELAVLWLDAHADYNTPETTPIGQPARHGAVASCAGDPILRADPRRPAASIRWRRPTSTSSAPARSIRASRRGCRAHGIDIVDMRAIDERGVSALLAERIAALAGARRAPARQLRRRLPRSRRWRPAPAPWCRAAPPTARRTWSWRCSATRPRRLGRRGRAQPLPRRARPHARVAATELVASLFGRTVLDRRPGAVSAA